MPEPGFDRDEQLRAYLEASVERRVPVDLADRAVARAARGRWYDTLRGAAGVGVAVAATAGIAGVVLVAHAGGGGHTPVTAAPAGRVSSSVPTTSGLPGPVPTGVPSPTVMVPTATPAPSPSAVVPQASASPVPSHPVPAAQELLVNSDFSQGTGFVAATWTTTGVANWFMGGASPGYEQIDAYLPAVSSVAQPVSIPQGRTATLQYAVDDYGCGHAISIELHVIAAGRDTTVDQIPSTGNCGQHISHSVSLTQYAGQTITVKVEVPSAGGSQYAGTAFFHLDQVALLAS